jgi:hypothetical protein
MFKEYSARSPVLLAPTDLDKARVKVAPEQCGPFAAQAIYHVTGTAAVVIVDLGTRTFQEAVMVKQFQPPQKLLLTAGYERTNMGRANKAKAPDQPDDFAVALGKPDGGYCGGAFEAGKADRLHASTISNWQWAQKTTSVAPSGKFA